MPLLIELDGRIYPGLALAAVMASTATTETELRVVNVNTSSLMLGGVRVPLDGKSNLLLRYRGPKRTFTYVSAADVLSGAAGPEAFKDKVVLVGTTALGTREVVSTPLDTLFAGVEVQATVADNLLQQDFIRRPEAGVALETQLVLGFGIVLALLVGRLGLHVGGHRGRRVDRGGLGGRLLAPFPRRVLHFSAFPDVSVFRRRWSRWRSPSSRSSIAAPIGRFRIAARRSD